MDSSFERFYNRAFENLKLAHKKLLATPKARGKLMDKEKKWLLEQLGESYRYGEIDFQFLDKITQKIHALKFDDLAKQREQIRFIEKIRKTK